MTKLKKREIDRWMDVDMYHVDKQIDRDRDRERKRQTDRE